MTTRIEWMETPNAHALRQRRYRQSDTYQALPREQRKGKNSQSGHKKTLLEQPICAIDGEGNTHSDGTHHYTDFRAVWGTKANERMSIQSESLTTEQCFEFLLALPPDHTYVGYGLSYDTNMWVRMLPYRTIDTLLDTGKAKFSNFQLHWIERKFFRITRCEQSFTIYDVLANWQTTFVAALKAWGVGTPEERELIEQMKEQRGNFAQVDKDEIARYCDLECELLRVLCRKLFDAILETPYRPKAVYGPGALAAAALEKHGVKKYLVTPPEPVNGLTRNAYFGGRFDCAMFGWFTDIWQYDIKSAYPDQIRFLPCLKCATWEHETAGFERIRPRKYGLYHVEWEVDTDVAWPPFPHRDAKGNVYYPYIGSGWYHGDEVDAAQAMYDSDAVRITEAWHLQVNCEHKPFEFVDSLYALRRELESTGGYDKGVVIKLILNSLYGKLAQQVGQRTKIEIDPETGVKRRVPVKPPFQCFFWAGAITAGTRAKILRALADNDRDVIGIATDSLVSMRELDFLPLGSELGEWDFKHLCEYVQVSNGVYHGTYDYPEKESGKVAERARGLGRFVLDYKRVEADFVRTRGTGVHVFPSRGRFITLREARQSLDRASIECRWTGAGTPNPQPDRSLDFMPARRMALRFTRKGPQGRPVTYLEPLAPHDYGAERESQPFTIKTKSREVIEKREKHNRFAWSDNE